MPQARLVFSVTLSGIDAERVRKHVERLRKKQPGLTMHRWMVELILTALEKEK